MNKLFFKTFLRFLKDILVSLNDNTFIILKMQVVNYNNKPLRSLAYFWRKYNKLHKGVDYLEIKPVYHIGFIDFTLFENHPEFFAKYQIRNAKDNYLYTDKFNLFVIELNHINLWLGCMGKTLQSQNIEGNQDDN